MTRFVYDRFTKDYLEKLLLEYGEVAPGRKVVSEVREIDVWFAPQKAQEVPELGLLGKMIVTSLLFEAFHNPATAGEIWDCLGKLSSVRREFQRQANREKRPLPEAEWPKLWILTPSASAAILEGFGAQPPADWDRGVYLSAPLLKTGFIVIHQLPRTPETLWLRILGRGRVLRQAIDDLEALPANNRFRAISLELLYNLQRNLEREPNKDEEDRELIMRLAPLYQQDREQAVQEGIEQGIEQGRQEGEASLVLRLLKRRFGELASTQEDQIRQLSIEKLENLGEALLDFENEEDLSNWLAQSRN